MTTSIKVRGLSKRFVLHNQNDAVLPVFSALDFDVSGGESLVLHGPSGAGKSTLLRMLFGNYLPTDGKIFIRHRDQWTDIVSAPSRLVLEVRRTSISFVSQFLRVIPRVTTMDVVMDRMLSRGVDESLARRRAADMLARLNLPERLWRLAPSTFSGGEQQRVNVARSFVDPTPILLLDEPTASLDAQNRDVVIDLVREATSAGHTIVGIFHDEYVRSRVMTRQFDLRPLSTANAP